MWIRKYKMNIAILKMLEKYNLNNSYDYEHALREIFQELSLLGLWRGKFFEKAAFYGGTALRILHGLDRFSEDLDFSLLEANSNFDFSKYLSFIERELSAWGFTVSVSLKKKVINSEIESAFLKSDTYNQVIEVKAPEYISKSIQKGRKLKIKIEVDTNPPLGFSTETQFLLNPIPFAIRTYTLDSLFAGKIHALLFRKWKNRIKGRDWYDFQWYLANDIPCNLSHLSQRMIQSGDLIKGSQLSNDSFHKLLIKRIEEVDFQKAKKDVEPFLKNTDSISLWSQPFFKALAKKTKTV
jgi:predicted nucleotidyltransferase component of viral defense system